MSLHEHNSGAASARELFKHSRLGKSSTLQWKKFLVLGFRFCQWRHKWSTFRLFWPTSPGPGPKPPDGSILLMFLLETRLKSESFDTVGDLLGSQVHNLRSILKQTK